MAIYISEADIADLERKGYIKVIPAKSTGPYRPTVGPSTPRPDTPPPKRSKYGNERVTVDGMTFDSQHEADYYFSELLPRKQNGELKLLLRQVPFELPGGIKYICDFFTVDRAGEVTVIDAKSEATRQNRVYINKKKQVKALYGLEIVEV